MAALPGSGGDVLGWAFRDELPYFSEVCGEGLLTRDGDELVDVRVYSFPINFYITGFVALTFGPAGDLATPSDCAMPPVHCLAPVHRPDPLVLQHTCHRYRFIFQPWPPPSSLSSRVLRPIFRTHFKKGCCGRCLADSPHFCP